MRTLRCFLAVLVSALSLINAVNAAESRVVKSLLEMRRERVIVQQFDLSCGAAALTTLLNFQHGEAFTEREVAKGLMRRAEYIENPELVQSHEGFSLLDLKRFVDARGYEGMGYGNLTFSDLLVKAPVMIPINAHGYNHFVIFRGIARNRVLLADPAWGNRTMSLAKFNALWIDYPQLGRVGFVVQRHDGMEPINLLAPREKDFVTLE